MIKIQWSRTPTNTTGGNMKHRYNVYSWINPRSGFDVRETNQILEEFRTLVKKLFSKEPEAMAALNRLLDQNVGKVLDMTVLESDEIIMDPEKELFSEVKKLYPEAIFITCLEIPSMTLTNKG